MKDNRLIKPIAMMIAIITLVGISILIRITMIKPSSIGIIGGADGPTDIYMQVASRVGPNILLGMITFIVILVAVKWKKTY